MKYYTVPTFALLAASGLLCLGMLKSFRRASQSASDLLAAQNETEMAQAKLIGSQRSATAAKAKSAAADTFLATWTPEISGDANIEQIFGRLDTLAVNHLLSPSGK